MLTADKTKAKQRTYSKLGYDKKDTQEIVDQLNILLANYHMLYQKLRNFHWNVKGPHFFNLHDKFEDEYNAAKVHIDDIAERIRVFGQTPLSNMTDYISEADIQESPTDLDEMAMVKTLLRDYETMVKVLNDTANIAASSDDLSTEDMAIAMIQEMEKTHWMFSAFVK